LIVARRREPFTVLAKGRVGQELNSFKLCCLRSLDRQSNRETSRRHSRVAHRGVRAVGRPSGSSKLLRCCIDHSFPYAHRTPPKITTRYSFPHFPGPNRAGETISCIRRASPVLYGTAGTPPSTKSRNPLIPLTYQCIAMACFSQRKSLQNAMLYGLILEMASFRGRTSERLEKEPILCFR
jgi:hypothetical protein